jgi:serine acetyltransferase
MQLKNLINSDLSIYHMRDISNEAYVRRKILFIKAYFDTDFRVVFWFRLYSYLFLGKFKQIAILLYFRVKSRYGVDIHPTAVIDEGFRLMHGFNIVIGPNVRIGKCCKIFNGVTLGKARPDNEKILMPEVGNFCILGTGAKILGKGVIKDCSMVGANHVTRRTKDGIESQDPLIREVYEEYVNKMKVVIGIDNI